MNRSSMSKFAAVAAAMTAATTFADTVAWWHFDEEAPGTVAASGVVTESVSGSTATSYTVWSNQVSQTDTYRPSFWRSFPGLAVYDPVAGTTNANHSAMRFKIARGGATPDANAGRAYYGGALKIDDGRSLCSSCTSAFTVEAFVCTTGGVFNTFAPIIGSLDGSQWTDEKWALYMESDSYTSGGLALRLNTSAGSTVRYQNNATRSISDGFWHHIAYTYDGSAATIYIDYVQAKRFTGNTISGTIAYGNNNAIWIGGYGSYDDSNGGRRFPGLIDEVRISNVALTPDKFLRLVSTEADEDTVLRLRFDAETSGELEDKEVVGGTFDLQAIYNAVSGSNASSFDTAAKPGDVVADGVYSDGVANVASYFQATNGTGKANFIKVANLTNRLFPSDSTASPAYFDYTVEMFFKLRSTSPNRQSIFKIGSGNYLVAQAITGDAGFPHQIQFAYRTNTVWKGVTTSASKPVDDGNWHHIAFVSDTANNRILTYYDYALVESRTGATPEVPRSYSIFLGANENGEQFLDGWIDDVRVTRRTLAPTEFLTTHPVGPTSPNPLFFATFENNYNFTCASNNFWSVTGGGLKNTSAGNLPTFENISPGKLLQDGINGEEQVSNDYSVQLNKSYVEMPVSPLYEQRAFTVEFWAKFTGIASSDGLYDINATIPQHAGILRFNRDTGTTWDWFFYRQNNNAKFGQVAIRNAAGEQKYLGFDFKRYIADGKWHHYALTFDTNEANTETTISVYDDYKLVGTNMCAGIYQYPGGHKLMLGMGSSNPPFMLGYVNSLRFWRGVITPDKFLGRVPRGTVVVVR